MEKRALFPTPVGSSRLSRLAADDVSGEKRARSRFIFPSVFFRTTLMPCQLERREKMKKKKRTWKNREGGRKRERDFSWVGNPIPYPFGWKSISGCYSGRHEVGRGRNE